MVYLLGGIVVVSFILTFVILVIGVVFGASTIADGEAKAGIVIIATCAFGLSLYAAVGLWLNDDGISDRTVHCGPGTEYRETSESWWCQAH